LFIWSFHVALFLFLSGVVYKLTGEWKNQKTKGRFILHKLLSLGVPYVVFSSVYIVINSLGGAVNTQSSIRDILFIWKTPVGTVCGIVFSVLAAIIAKKVRFLNFFFFPTKVLRKKRLEQK
jgi:fucose 4-O-acetylase-like acetyltransferase